MRPLIRFRLRRNVITSHFMSQCRPEAAKNLFTRLKTHPSHWSLTAFVFLVISELFSIILFLFLLNISTIITLNIPSPR